MAFDSPDFHGIAHITSVGRFNISQNPVAQQTRGEFEKEVRDGIRNLLSEKGLVAKTVTTD